MGMKIKTTKQIIIGYYELCSKAETLEGYVLSRKTHRYRNLSTDHVCRKKHFENFGIFQRIKTWSLA